MSDEPQSPVDRAVEVATDRAKSAEREYIETPPADEDAVVLAAKVERRAEDLDVLAGDAAGDDPAKP
jgi:hypothetical protein